MLKTVSFYNSGALPGGSNTNVQYNNNGTFSGNANFTYDGTNAIIANDAKINNLTIGKGSGSAANNTVLGELALAGASGTNTGTQITAIGYGSLYKNISGSNLTSIGSSSLQNNTSGSYNSSLGEECLFSNTTGSMNTCGGYQAGYSNTTGSNLVTLGYQAGYSNTTASNSIYIGQAAGYNITTGINNVFIGHGSGYFANNNITNTVILGNWQGSGAVSNTIYLSDGGGNIGANWTNGGGWYQQNNATLWSITSDIRIKKNIVSLESGLDVISALRPVEFDYIENDKHDIGFIAQEYQTVLPAQISEGEDGMLSLNQNLVPYLVKAIQELTTKIANLESKLGV